MRALVLGTAGAWPIPRPGCPCPQCEEARADPRLARTRTGLWVQAPGADVLVDTGLDVCAQFEKAHLPVLADAVIITHRHVDHILGLDDVAHVRQGGDGPLAVHVGADHRPKLTGLYRHLLREERPRIRFEDWGEGEQLEFGAVTFEGFETHHRERFTTTAVLLHVPWEGRMARIAYATDMSMEVPTPRERLEGVDLFVGDGSFLGAGGYGHPGTDRMLEIARELGAGRVAVTHVGHWQVEDAAAQASLGDDVVICRDGDDLCALLPGA